MLADLNNVARGDSMDEKKRGGFVEKMATFIVDKRNLFFLVYIFAFIFCIFSMNWVQVENDVTIYLPEDTQTRQGIVAMNENFVTFGTAQVMVSNITYDTAQELCEQLAAVEGVDMVTFDDTPEHYTKASALYDISFAGGNSDEISVRAMAEIEEKLSSYDVSVYTSVGYDENAMLQQEMTTILVVAVIIIVTVLTLTSRAYMEVPVLFLTFGAAALLNMGTNFLCGKISFISDSIAVVLQLALAIDYAIILCHRFSDEHETKDARQSAIIALSKAIPEIGGSSMTTVSGLAALAFMKFGIGLDMAVVLIKAILLSLFSVFTLMPGLLVLFCPLIDKTRHKKLLPNITFAGKFAVKTRRPRYCSLTKVSIAAAWGLITHFVTICRHSLPSAVNCNQLKSFASNCDQLQSIAINCASHPIQSNPNPNPNPNPTPNPNPEKQAGPAGRRCVGFVV